MLENAMDDIAFEDHSRIDVRATERVSSVFNALNIFMGDEQKLPPNPHRVIRIPKSVTFEEYSSFQGDTLFEIGALSYSESPNPVIRAGRYCSVAGGLSVFGERHPIERVTSSSFTYCFRPNWNKPQFLRVHDTLLGRTYQPDLPAGETILPVVEHDVWIGQHVQLARGITLGTGCVIGAGTLVTKDVPPYAIVGGNPARFIKWRFPPELAARLAGSRWWELHPRVLYDFGYADPSAFCDRIEQARALGMPLEAWKVRRLSWNDVITRLHAKGVPEAVTL